jgi:hypothetical protein
VSVGDTRDLLATITFWNGIALIHQNLRDYKGQTSRGISEDGCDVTDCQRKEANDKTPIFLKCLDAEHII